MISRLLETMDKNSHKQVSYDEFHEITQEPKDNVSFLMSCFTKAMVISASKDPNSREGLLLLYILLVV